MVILKKLRAILFSSLLLLLLLLIVGCTTKIPAEKVTQTSFDNSPTKEVTQISSNNSPFGAHGKLHNDELQSRMGIKWIRLAGSQGLHFGKPQKNFKHALNEAVKNNLNVVVTISTGVVKPECTQKYPENIEKYKEFLRNAVNEYKDKVQYYQFENEPAGNFWCDTPENYAKLLKYSYLTVKESCPECKIVIAGATSSRFGIGNNDFYNTVFSTLKTYPECAQNGCYDIFDLHLVSCDICLYPKAKVKCEAKKCSFDFMTTAYETAKTLQNNYGYSKPIWSTEFGTFSLGNLENTQISLIKSFVYAHHLGFEKLFWRVSEDCCKIIDNNQPTSTYYAYKTLIEKISRYLTLTKIDDAQYRFTFLNRKPVYLLWCNSEICSIPSEITNTVKVTNYIGNETTTNAEQIVLTENPVFIEQN